MKAETREWHDDEASERAVAAKAAELDFDTSVEQDEETETWTCFCGRRMVPAYAAVRAIEEQLDALGREGARGKAY